MSIPTTAASPWPRNFAYAAASVFLAASTILNTSYGWAKGDTIATSLVWAGIAAATAVVFTLTWPATVRALHNRDWSGAVMAVVGLVLFGSYNVTAAIGSAAGGRANASNAETATVDARKRAQSAHDTARDELARIPHARPVAEVEALLVGAKPQCRIVVELGRRDTVCGPPAALTAELGRSKRRIELEGKIELAAAELGKTVPARVANSDAVALASFAQGLGLDLDADRINKLLVLLAVLIVECGAGLSLTVALALSGAPASRTAAPADTSVEQPEQPQSPALNALSSTGAASGTIQAPAFTPSVQMRSAPAPAVQAADIVELVREAGGMLRTTTRRLGVQLGRPAASVHGELRRLVSAGLISLNADSRGTLITVAPAARSN